MDESLKVIVDKHWSTLVRYINPTQALISVLVEDRVLPPTMINDIQKGLSRREKNETLLKCIKLRGNTSYRKFRDAMLKCGQIFVADLLFEEEGPMSFVEESDFSGFPALKLSLSPAVLNQFILLLDAKIRARVLKKEWMTNSNSRLELLMSRAEDNRSLMQAQACAKEKDEKIKQLTGDISLKNDIIRTLSLDINILNTEVDTFLQRCSGKMQEDLVNITNSAAGQAKPGTYINTAPPTPRGNSGAAAVWLPATTDGLFSTGHQEKQISNRFSHLDKALTLIYGRLLTILGLPLPNEGEVTRIGVIYESAKKVQELVSEMREHLQRTTQDQEVALKLLDIDLEEMGEVTMATSVERHLQNEQQQRCFLLKDIDRLSCKLRGISKLRQNSELRQNSGLFSLLQSAVTGQPQPETVDYRFLSNHISLLEADAAHIQKKLRWKEADVKALQQELAALKSRSDDDMNDTLSSDANITVVDASTVKSTSL